MVLADIRRSTDGIADNLREQDLGAVAALAAGGAGGVIVAQEVADLVLPLLNMSPDPTSPRGLGASVLVKLGVATVVATVASQASQNVQALAGLLILGHLVSAGADFFDMLQRGGIPGASPSGGASRSRSPAPSRSTRSGSVSPGGSGSSGTTSSATSVSV